jgi:hypothetical protein
MINHAVYSTIIDFTMSLHGEAKRSTSSENDPREHIVSEYRM